MQYSEKENGKYSDFSDLPTTWANISNVPLDLFYSNFNLKSFFFQFLIKTETALPGIFNETCVKPKKESTMVVYTGNILEERSRKL